MEPKIANRITQVAEYLILHLDQQAYVRQNLPVMSAQGAITPDIAIVERREYTSIPKWYEVILLIEFKEPNFELLRDSYLNNYWYVTDKAVTIVGDGYIHSCCPSRRPEEIDCPIPIPRFENVIIPVSKLLL